MYITWFETCEVFEREHNFVHYFAGLIYDDKLFLFEKRLLDAVEQWYSKALSDSNIEWTLNTYCTTVHRLQIFRKRTNRQARLSILTLIYNKCITIVIVMIKVVYACSKVSHNNYRIHMHFKGALHSLLRMRGVCLHFLFTLNLVPILQHALVIL